MDRKFGLKRSMALCMSLILMIAMIFPVNVYAAARSISFAIKTDASAGTIDIKNNSNGSKKKLYDNDSYTIDTNQSYTVIANANTGYRFDKWTASNVTLSSTTSETANISSTNSATRSITANFTRQYILSTSVSGGNGTVTGADTYDSGTTATLRATPVSGYRFAGWSGDAAGTNNPLSITMNGNKIVTANFAVSPKLTYTATSFTETYANDGTVTGTAIVTLQQGTFAAAASGNTFGTSQYTPAVPAGLSMVVTRINNTQLSIQLSGKANVHTAAKSGNVGITFTNAAFEAGLKAADVDGSSKSDFKIEFLNASNLTYESGNFMESDENDGTIGNAKYVSLEGALFNTASFKTGTPYTITNVPAGLTASAVVMSDHWIRFDLRGKAENHGAATRSIAVTFQREAFVEGLAQYNNLLASHTFNITFIGSAPKLKVLEIYPSGIGTATVETKLNHTDIQTLKTVLSGSAKYDVTSISINKFISLNEELNGNYDIVYFGEGSYLRNSVTENNYGNDLTTKAANKVKDFINAGQVCLFSDSVDIRPQYKESGTWKNFDSTNTVIKDLAGSSARVTAGSINTMAKAESLLNGAYQQPNVNRRPVLTLYEAPASYRNMSQSVENHTLTYKFKVSDPDINQTTLSAILYIDRNNDSLFDEKEICEKQTVNNGKDQVLSYSIPEGLTGIFFWKIVISDPKGARDEASDIVHLNGEQILLNVLQILPFDTVASQPSDYTGDLAALFANTVDGGYPIGYHPGEYKVNVAKKGIGEFNTAAQSGQIILNGAYDMIVLGFKDNYASTSLNPAAVALLNSFIATHQGVMFTHDTIYDEGDAVLRNNYRTTVGQTTAKAASNMYRRVSEGIGSGNISSTLYNAYALADYQYVRARYTGGSPSNLVTQVGKVNSTAITLYPFNLESINNGIIDIAPTHTQYFKLDLEDEKVIPLFNMNKGTMSRLNDDAMSNYYTYSYGNITYSGTGHAYNPGQTNECYSYTTNELKLFVNTMLKAYASANHKPFITLYEPTDWKKVNRTDTKLHLNFKISDFDHDDDMLNYIVYRQDAGSPVYTAATPTSSAIREVIQDIDIDKGQTVGMMKVKIVAWDTNHAERSVEVNIENTEDPLISQLISFYDKDGIKRDNYLVGEEVNVRIDMTASGYAIPNAAVTPELSVKKKYTEGGIEQTKELVTSRPLSPVTFSVTTPAPMSLAVNDIKTTAEIASTVDASNMLVSSTVEFAIGDRKIPNTPQETPISVRNGQVWFSVKDEQGNPIPNVMIKEAASGDTWTTDTTGSNRGNRNVTGKHTYELETSSLEGYLYEDGMKLYKVDPATNVRSPEVTGTGGQVDVTYGNYVWEVEFTVKFDLQVHYTYYQLKNDNSVIKLGDDSVLNEMKVQKKAPANILVKMDIEHCVKSVVGIRFEKISTRKNGALIADSSPSFAKVVTGTGITVKNATDPVIGLDGVIPLNKYNHVADENTDDYSGKSYFFVIHLDEADALQIDLEDIEVKLYHESEYKVIPHYGVRTLNIVNNISVPLLR